jgi:undecaprenyl-diphosphatase
MWMIGILGAMQGLTEFLPVSSSGHLIFVRFLFGVQSPGASLEVFLHLGTLVAVVWVYRHWIAAWIAGLLHGQSNAYHMLACLGVASVPVALLGLLARPWLEGYFTLGAAIAGWIGSGILLWVMPDPREWAEGHGLGVYEAWWIGCAQALALWPGLSRSGSTIAMARYLGVEPNDAAQFSFLLAIPTVLGASLVEIPQLTLAHVSWAKWGFGALIAAITGVIAIQWITRIVNRPRAWQGFAVYLWGLAVLAWILGG